MNRSIIIGRLTKDPELRQTQNNIPVCSFTVAVDRPKKKDEDAKTDFIGCQAWRQSAEYLTRYGFKGALIAVEGKIQTRNYDDKDGKKIYITEIVADNVSVLSKKQESNSGMHSAYSIYKEDIKTDDTFPAQDDENLPF